MTEDYEKFYIGLTHYFQRKNTILDSKESAHYLGLLSYLYLLEQHEQITIHIKITRTHTDLGRNP